MPAGTCPNRETLLRYSMGMLSNEDSDELAGHLDGCPDCQATVLTLEDAEDTLIGRLRTPPSGESCLAEPQFQAALAGAIGMAETGPAAREDLGRRGPAGLGPAADARRIPGPGRIGPRRHGPGL